MSVTRLPSGRAAVGWRLVDALIAVRRAGAAHTPARLRRTLLLLPALLLVGVLAAGLAALAWRSVHAYDTFLAQTGGLSLTQYSTVLGDEQFHRVLARSLLMAVVVPLITTAVAVPFALAMARSRRRAVRLVLLIGLFVPVLTGDITRTYGWLVTLGPQGPLAWLTDALGLGRPELLGTLVSIGLGMSQLLLPVAVVILLPAVLRCDRELEWAAATMGAPPRQVFLRVTLPQLRGACVAALAAGFALAMAAFADPAVLGRGLKGFVGNLLQERYLGTGNPALGAAIGMLLLGIVSLGTALVLLLGGRRSRRRA